MTAPIQFGIRIAVDATAAEGQIERIGAAGTKMAGQLEQAGQAMTTALSSGGAAASQAAQNMASFAETEEQASERIRAMVAASLQQTTAFAQNAQVTSMAAASSRQAASENVNLAESLARVNAQMHQGHTSAPSIGGATSSQEAEAYVATLKRQLDVTGLNAAEQAQYQVAMLGGSKATQQQAHAIVQNTEALREQIAAEQRNDQAATQFINRLKEQVSTLGMSRNQLLAHRAAQLGVADAAAPMIARLTEAEVAAGKAGHASAGVTRELIVLGHEAVSGNFSRMPGSFMVLAEQINLTSLLMNPFVLGLVAATAAAGFYVAAVVNAHTEMVEMNNAIAVTGNYAGQTRASIMSLAEGVAASGQVTIGVAKDIVTSLVASGQVGGQALGTIARLASDYAKVTHQDIDEIGPKLAKLFSDPSKGARELNSDMHFLNETDLEHIDTLTRLGEKQEAQLVLAEKLSAWLPKQAGNVGWLSKQYQELKNFVSALNDELGKMQDTSSPEAKIRALQAQRQRYQALADMGGGYARAGGDKLTTEQAKAAVKDIDDQIAAQQRLQQVAAQTAAAQAEGTRQAERGAAAQEEVNKSQLTHLMHLQDALELTKAAPDSASKEQRQLELQKQIDAAYRAMSADSMAATQQQYAHEEALAQIRLKGAAEAITTSHQLGAIDTVTFITRMNNNEQEQLKAKQFYEQRMARMTNLTEAERQAHLDKVGQIEAEINLLKKRGANQVEVESKKEIDDLIASIQQAGIASGKSLDDQIAKQKEHNAEIGKTKSQIELARKATEDLTTAQMQADAEFIRGVIAQGNMDQQATAVYRMRLAYLDSEVEKRKQLSALLATGSQLEGVAAAKSSLDKLFDPTKAQSFGDTIRGSFGAAGDSMSKLIGTLDTYSAKEAQIAKARKDAAVAYAGNATALANVTTQINNRELRDRLGAYASMAGAAKGFFSEHSKGYKAMHAVEQAFHAVELAMAMESMVKKLFFKETEVATNLALNGTKLAGEAATTAASTGLAATEASAWGITAVVKAIASLPFPFNMLAGAATLAAVVAIGAKITGSLGGSSMSLSQQRQAEQGTGTVLGDSSAKSDSLNKAIELTASNSSTQIDYLAGLLSTLRTIQSNISSFASELVRSTDIINPNVSLSGGSTKATMEGQMGLFGGSSVLGSGAGALNASAMLGGPIGVTAISIATELARKTPIIGKLMTSVFGGKQSLEDSGFTLDRTSLAAVLAGKINAQSYADVKTSGGWFGKDKHSEQLNAMGAEANQQFSTIIKSLSAGVSQAGELLGIAGDDFTQRLQGFVVDIGHVSLKGMSGEEIQKALEAVFSKLGDQMASYAISGLQQFQQVGEGYLQTLVRVAADYAKVDASLQSIGKTFGSVGIDSVAARENLISLMGGIDEFQSKTADFAKNFLTKAQQQAPVAAFVDKKLQDLNLGWVKTAEQFAEVVQGLDLTTEAGRNTYSALMSLEGAFAATHEAIKDVTRTAQDIADERKDLQNQLDQLTMTQAQLLKKQRDAVDASNRSLFDQVQAAQKAKDAQDAAKTSLGNFISQMKNFATTAANLNNQLLLGSSSNLTPEQQYAEARRQFEQTRKAAAAGDATAQGNLSSVENAFLQISQKINGSDAQYSSDLAAVLRTNDELSTWAASSVDVAQASLDALNDSNATLADISATLTAIAKGTQYQPVARSSQDATVFTPAAPSLDYSRFGTADMTALVAEVKALREEVKAQRADGKQQTGDLIRANAAAANSAADIVVRGVDKAISDSTWSANNSARTLK